MSTESRWSDGLLRGDLAASARMVALGGALLSDTASGVRPSWKGVRLRRFLASRWESRRRRERDSI